MLFQLAYHPVDTLQGEQGTGLAMQVVFNIQHMGAEGANKRRSAAGSASADSQRAVIC
jgi:hypothetical protein